MDSGVSRGGGLSQSRGVSSSSGISYKAQSSQTLESLISSAVAEWDATKNTASSQDILNQVTTPADGSSQSDYDLWLGSSSGHPEANADPLFGGSGPSAYYEDDSIDGDTYGGLLKAGATPNAASNQPQFVLDMAKASDNTWTQVWCGRLPTTHSNSHTILFGTQNANALVRGWNFSYCSNQTNKSMAAHGFSLRIMDGSGTIKELFFEGTYAVEQKDVLIMLSVSVSGGTMTATLRINGLPPRSVSAALTDTGNGEGTYNFMNDDSFSTDSFSAGKRWYWSALFNAALGSADYTTIADYLLTKRGVDFRDSVASLTGLRIVIPNYANKSSNWLGLEEVNVWDGTRGGDLDADIMDGLTNVADIQHATFSDISAGQFITSSDYSAKNAALLNGGWANTSVHWSNSDQGGMVILLKPSAPISVGEVNIRMDSTSTYSVDPSLVTFLDQDGNYLIPTTLPADNTDNDTTLDAPNTDAFTWLF